jgi:hypothetical protein
MTQPLHTPGPLRIERCKSGGWRHYIKGATENPEFVIAETDEDHCRLLAAAYNAFDSAARKLGCNAVELAERMQDGELAELIEAARAFLHDHDLGFYGEEAHTTATRLKEALPQVKGGAP